MYFRNQNNLHKKKKLQKTVERRFDEKPVKQYVATDFERVIAVFPKLYVNVVRNVSKIELDP